MNKIIEREGIFYIQFEDGEVEISKERMEQLYSTSIQMKGYLEVGMNYLKGEKYNIGNVPQEFDEVVKVDLFIDKLIPVLEKLYTEAESTANAKNTILQILQMLIYGAMEKTVNPLMKRNKNVSEYFVHRLETVKNSWDVDIPQLTKRPKPNLSIDQIALKYAYEQEQITRANGNEIARQYGHTSGEKLFQRYTHYSKASNRRGKPRLCTPKKLENKMKLVESIIDILSIDKQTKAKEEISILKKIYDEEYL